MSEEVDPEEPDEEEAEKLEALIDLKQFLEETPPNSACELYERFTVAYRQSGARIHTIELPRIKIHCPNGECSGERYFDPSKASLEFYRLNTSAFLDFTCSNCGANKKRYSIHISVEDHDDETGYGRLRCEKYGEVPSFGVPTPTKLLSLLGQDRDLFLKGRRCESQGLGVGAFAYYRRAVENRKSELVSEIIKVAKLVGSGSEIISALEAAQKETQFSKALSDVKDAIPESLKIKGQNPLTLLHSALSDGLHDRTDDECLSIAHDVRIVLAELSERIVAALKDTAELTSAVDRLSSARSRPKISKMAKN
ncbi:hypothetical protein [uncultured Hyphomonas sp.]|uniref:hypothetical protein n=1 Tax=uncultured Hyphomonas sp. TaxID=225298 RepID=UPI0030D840B3